MDIMDFMDIMDIMDFMDNMDIMNIMNIMNITAWMAMAVLYCNTPHKSTKVILRFILPCKSECQPILQN